MGARALQQQIKMAVRELELLISHLLTGLKEETAVLKFEDGLNNIYYLLAYSDRQAYCSGQVKTDTF